MYLMDNNLKMEYSFCLPQLITDWISFHLIFYALVVILVASSLLNILEMKYFYFVPIHCLWSLLSFVCQVLPSLREKHDEFMLRELVKRWSNHKIMVRWLSRFFHYLDRYFIARRSLHPLNEVGLSCFRDLVCQHSFSFLYIYILIYQICALISHCWLILNTIKHSLCFVVQVYNELKDKAKDAVIALVRSLLGNLTHAFCTPSMRLMLTVHILKQ